MSNPSVAALRAAGVLSTSKVGPHGGFGASCPACHDMAVLIDRETGLAGLLAEVRDMVGLLDRGPDMRGPVFFAALWKQREKLRSALSQTGGGGK